MKTNTKAQRKKWKEDHEEKKRLESIQYPEQKPVDYVTVNGIDMRIDAGNGYPGDPIELA